MLVVSFFTWYYSVGWTRLMHGVWARVIGALKFFSVAILISSLFAPFRQISAGGLHGSLQVQLRGWVDRQFSRIVGAAVRLMLILAGLMCALVIAIFGIIIIIFWPFLPIAPLIGVFLMQARLGL